MLFKSLLLFVTLTMVTSHEIYDRTEIFGPLTKDQMELRKMLGEHEVKVQGLLQVRVHAFSSNC